MSNEINAKITQFSMFTEGQMGVRLTLTHKKPISLFPLGLNFEMPEVIDEDGWAKSHLALEVNENGNIVVSCNAKVIADDLMSAFCFLDGSFQISTEGEILIESYSIHDQDGMELDFPEEEFLRISDSQQFFGAAQSFKIEPTKDRIVVSIQVEEKVRSELSFEIVEVDKEYPSASIMLQHDFDDQDKCFFNIYRDVFDQNGKYIQSLREKVGYCAYFEGEPYTVSLHFKVKEDIAEQSTVDTFFQIGNKITTKLDVAIPINTISHIKVRQSYYKDVPGNYTIKNLLATKEVKSSEPALS